LKKAKEIVIIGAGMAGICAALSAAEDGNSVTIIESSDSIGGNATLSNVGTICGSYLRSNSGRPALVGNQFTQSFIAKLLKTFNLKTPLNYHKGLHIIPYDWKELKQFLLDEITSKPSIKICYNTFVKNVNTNTNTISKIITNNEHQEIACDSVIDCTGKAIISKILNHPLIKSENYQAASQVFRVCNVNSNSEFTVNMSVKKMILRKVEKNNWPNSYKSFSVVPGSFKKKNLDLKLTLPDIISDETDFQNLKINAHKSVQLVFDELKSQLDSFKNSEIRTIFPEVGVRILNRPKGKEILSEKDILNTKKSDSGIAVGSWPIEYWNKNGEIELTIFNENDYYLIPANCLISNKINNLYFAGKNISATDKAIASARVIGTCIQTGYAAGKMASNTGNLAETVSQLRTELKIADEYI
jgi:hypothetical protein